MPDPPEPTILDRLSTDLLRHPPAAPVGSRHVPWYALSHPWLKRPADQPGQPTLCHRYQ